VAAVTGNFEGNKAAGRDALAFAPCLFFWREILDGCTEDPVGVQDLLGGAGSKVEGKEGLARGPGFGAEEEDGGTVRGESGARGAAQLEVSGG
jgi:hypothetical protein